MPKFDVKKLIKFRNTYKKYTKVAAEVGNMSIAQEAALMSKSTAEYITFKANELLDNEKEISKQMLNNKIAIQTSEGTIKDNSLIQISDNDEEKLNRAAEAVGLCYAMEVALQTSYSKEKDTAAYEQMVADVKKAYNITNEQFNAFKQVIHNVSLNTDTYKDHAINEDGSFKSQVEKAPIETVSEKNARNSAEKILKGNISIEKDIIESNENTAHEKIVEDIKGKLLFGFVARKQDIKNADYYVKQAMQDPQGNGVKPSLNGTYDKDSYLKYFDDAIQQATNKNNKDIDDESKEIAGYVKQMIKGEVKDSEVMFNTKVDSKTRTARDAVTRDKQNLFSIKLGKYFAAKQFWQNKGILDIIAHPFKAYDQYQEMKSIKAEFMREYDISEKEMEKIDNFQKANKLPKEIPNNYKIGDVDEKDIKDIELIYNENNNKLNLDGNLSYRGQEDNRRKILSNFSYYKDQNEKEYHMSEKSVEKQIEEKTNELQEEFNKKYGSTEMVNNNIEKNKETEKSVGANK